MKLRWQSGAGRLNISLVTEFDQLAEHYDESRGGERRGEDYAADIESRLPPGQGPILEIGVGTGVVALGLVRRGRTVIGLDLSAPMLSRARARLGDVVVRSDATRMSIATASVAHAVSVWVLHSVKEPVRLFEEAARVIRRGGRYLVYVTQRPAPDDEVGQIISAMSVRVDLRRGAARPRGVAIDEVLAWAGEAGLVGEASTFELQFRSSPADELRAIARRSWPALRELDEAAIEEVTSPAVEALLALPAGERLRRGTADIADLHHR